MYSHAPALTSLLALPKKANEWENLLQPLRERYADIPAIVEAAHPREMLLALYALSTALLRGDARPDQPEARFENYSICADDYHKLHAAAKSLDVAA